ncbi:MAG: hypothetical protein ACRDLN_03575 [Solirubrobacteraceae bacterium]
MLLPPSRRRSLFDARVAAAYLLGTSTGAILTALAAWLLSGFAEPLSDGVRLALLAAGGVLLWAIKHGPLEGAVALPEARRQIPAQVFGGSLARGAYRFGFELGTGMRTYVPSAAPYVLLLVVVLSRPSLLGAVAVGLAFGFARALPVLVQLAPPPIRRSRFHRASAHPAAATLTTVVVLAGGFVLV